MELTTFKHLETIERIRARYHIPWKAIKVMVLAYESQNVGIALDEIQERGWSDVLGVDFEFCELWCFSGQGSKRLGHYRKLFKLTGAGLRVTEQLIIGSRPIGRGQPNLKEERRVPH